MKASPSSILREPVETRAGDRILLRLADGTLHDAAVATAAGKTDTLTITPPVPANAWAAGAPENVIWRLYAAAKPPIRARVVSVEPLSAARYRLTAVDDVDAYYTG